MNIENLKQDIRSRDRFNNIFIPTNASKQWLEDVLVWLDAIEEGKQNNDL